MSSASFFDQDPIAGPLLNSFSDTGMEDLTDGSDVEVADPETSPTLNQDFDTEQDLWREAFDAENTGHPLADTEIPGANQILGPDDFDEVIETHSDEGYPENAIPTDEQELDFTEEEEQDFGFDREDTATVDEFDEVDNTSEVSEYEEVDERDEVDQAEEVAEAEHGDPFPEDDDDGFVFHDNPEEDDARLDEEIFEIEGPEEALAETLLEHLEEEGFDTETLEEFLFPDEEDEAGDDDVDFADDSDPFDLVTDLFDSFDLGDILGDDTGSEASGEPLGDDDGLDINDGFDDVDGEGALDLPEEVTDWFGLDFDFGADDHDFADHIVADQQGGDFGDFIFEITEESMFDWVADELDDLGYELDWV